MIILTLSLVLPSTTAPYSGIQDTENSMLVWGIELPYVTSVERGDTWEKTTWSDGLVEHTFGKQEFIQTSDGSYKAYEITTTPTHINVDSKVTPLSFDKSNCTNEIKKRDGTGTFIGQEYWGIVTNSGSGWSLYDVLQLDCEYETGNSNDGKTLTVTREHPKAQIISELTLNNDGSLSKPFLTLINNGEPVNAILDGNGTETSPAIAGGFENLKVSFANVWKNVSASSITFADTTYSGAELTSLFPNGVPTTFTKVQIDYFLAKHQLKAITFTTSDGDTFIYDTTLGYDDLVELEVTRNGALADMVWVYGKPTNIVRGDTITLDPTFGYTVGIDKRYYSALTVGGETDCSTLAVGGSDTNVQGHLRTSDMMYDIPSLIQCQAYTIRTDISSLDTSYVVTSATIRHDVDAISSPNGCDIMPLTNDPDVGSDATMWTDIHDGTPYADDDTTCNAVADDNTIDITSAISDIQTAISSGVFYYAFVQGNHDAISGTSLTTIDPNTVELQITYSIPSVPTAPTVDSVSTTSETAQLTVGYTNSSNLDTSAQPIIANYTIWTGETLYLNTPLVNFNATQNSENSTSLGAITTSTGFEGLFHFDTLYTSNELGSANFTDYSGSDNHATIECNSFICFGSALSYENDFTGCTTETCSGEFTSGNIFNAYVHAPNDYLYMHTQGGDFDTVAISYDLHQSIADVADTWVLRLTDWQQISTAVDNSCGGTRGWFGLTSQDANYSRDGTDEDFVGLQSGRGIIIGTGIESWADDWENQAYLNTNGGTASYTHTFGTDYNVEIVQTSGTTFNLIWYASGDWETPLHSVIGETKADNDYRYFTMSSLYHSDGICTTERAEYKVDKITFWNDAVDPDNTGSVAIELSSIDSDLSNELQFTGAGLNITSTSYPSGTSAFTINGIITPNQTTAWTLMSAGSTAGDILFNVDDSFVGMSIGGTDIFNKTLSTAMNSGSATAISITRTVAGV